MKSFLGVAIAVTLLAAVVIYVYPVEAAPYYSTGNHVIKAIVRFDSDCWEEIYARATPKNNIQTVLNKQTIENNDTPDAGPSEVLRLQWKFSSAKMETTADTNEGRFRTYVTIELADGSTGETVTKYKAFDAGKRTFDFGTFRMHTDKSLCQ